MSCADESVPSSPKKTFETYIKALKQKDTTAMKLLLSSETIKAHEQEAKAQSVTVDDIVKRETLWSEGQKVVELRNEKIEGEKATLEVKDPYGRWETLFFILENGEWKIDKKGAADQLLREIEEDNRKADEMMNSNSLIDPPMISPTPPSEPVMTPTPPLDASNLNRP